MRRSRSVPTPRGGGIGIVIAIVVCGLLPSIAPRRSNTASPSAGSFRASSASRSSAGSTITADFAGKRFAMHCAAALDISRSPCCRLPR